MVKFESYLVNDFDTEENGNKAVSVEITIYNAGTRVKATLFNEDGSTSSNPVTTTEGGQYSFWVNVNKYDFVTDANTDKEFYLYTNKDLSSEGENRGFVYEFPPQDTNVFELPPVAFDDGESILTSIPQFEVDGSILPPSMYELSEDKKTVTVDTVITESSIVVTRMTLQGSSIPVTGGKVGYITDYLAKDLSVSDAIIAASENHTIVDFEGVEIETDDLVEIPETALCRKWRLAGASLKFKYGQVIFNNRMFDIDLAGGTIDLGLTLAQASEDGPKDAISVKVKEGHSLEVGSYLNSSLDIDYLPNATDRVGYIENGDYNRIQSITSNGDGTDTVTLTYSFLPSSNPQVYSGIIKNAWLGNSSFNLTGLDFRGNPDGSLRVHGGTVKNPRGYCITLVNGDGDLRKATLEIDITVENSFIDMIRFQGHGITFGKNYHAMRQYDLAKQHLVCSIPVDGYIKYQAGCRIERQNGDAEVFATSFDPTQTSADCGVIDVEKGVLFNGTKPADLPESDFSPGGQIYFGYNVPIHDCYHFVQPNAPHVEMGGMSFSGEVIGFQRSIYGTTFSPKDSFKTGPVNFYGAKLSCEPVFISINGGVNAQTRMSEYPVSLDGCYIESRGLPNFDGGAYIYAKQCYIKLPLANRDTPQLNGSQGFNFITMEGGYLDGRYAIAGSDTILKNVHLPYSDDPSNVPIFQNGNLPNPNDTHLILDPPLDDLYDGVSFSDVYETIDTEKWFGTNYSTRAPSPPNLRFKFTNYPQVMAFGGVGGYARRYQVQMISSRVDLPPMPTKGKWSGLIDDYDRVLVSATGQQNIVEKSEQTTITSAASVGDLTVTVATAPSGTPAFIGIYQSTFGEYIYYNVSSVNGGIIGIGESYTANTGILPNIGHPENSEVTFVYYKSVSSEGYLGAMVERVNNFTWPTDGNPHSMIFDGVVYDDSNGGFFPSASGDKVYAVNDMGRADLTAYIGFGPNAFLASNQYHLRIIQYDSAGNRVRIAASCGGDIGYRDLKVSTTCQGIPVSNGDYFELQFRTNDTSAPSVNECYMQIRRS